MAELGRRPLTQLSVPCSLVSVWGLGDRSALLTQPATLIEGNVILIERARWIDGYLDMAHGGTEGEGLTQDE